MGIRRFTRLMNAFSKKVENHRHMVALRRVHSTLRVSPAMEAGLSDHVWSIEEMCSLLPKTASSVDYIDKALTPKALGEKPA
jgi:hypothetical protein